MVYNVTITMEGWLHTMPRTGETPGKGEYTCDDCGQVVALDDDSDTMPPCPKCGGSDFH